MNYFSTFHHACMYHQLLRFMSFTFNFKNKIAKTSQNSRNTYKKYLIQAIKNSVKTDILEREPMSPCQQKVLFILQASVFLISLFNEIVSIIRYVQGWNLIYTLEIMVKSDLQKRRIKYSDPRSYIQKEQSNTYYESFLALQNV